MSLIYYFDIGNTRIKLWRCHNSQIEGHVSEVHAGDPGAVIAGLPDVFSIIPDAVLGASVLASPAMLKFTQACLSKWQQTPEYAHSALQQAGVINAYGDASASLGIDRWLGLLAAHAMLSDVCVVDCGTAITLDVLRHDGCHLGGYILPGLALMSDALIRDTERVRFTVSVPAVLDLGKNTAAAVMNGAMLAVVAMIERVAAEHQVKIVLTGGDARIISAQLSAAHVVESELLLHGLQRYFADAGIT